MAAAAIFKNRQISISRPRLERIRRNLAEWCSSTRLTVLTVKSFKFQKSKMAAAAILKYRKIAIFRPRWKDFDKIWHSDAVQPSWPFWPLKIEILKIQAENWYVNDLHRSFNTDERSGFYKTTTQSWIFGNPLIRQEVIKIESSDLVCE